ncbi:MAG: ribosome recycling factor [Ruminococcus sp.]|nr:ribosome recycling factor [Ruminococcus sp.]
MKEVLKRAEERMQRRINHLNDEYKTIRAGRANPSILDKVTVDYYGTPTPVNQVANVSVPEARMITIQPWDASMLGAINKAIQTSEIGINPQNDGKMIRLNFPPLTEDRRKEIVKDVAKIAEGTKVQIRNVRRDAMDDLKKLKKNSEITEDDLKDGEKKVQKLTDKFIKETDSICSDKQKEIMEL